MKKLVRGIVEFRRSRLEEYRARFAHLVKGQWPDALMVACSDSRVAPNTFASTDPGDLFVVRNVGNFVPACGAGCGGATEACGGDLAGNSSGGEVAAAIEFALGQLRVTDVIVCGHSECGAIEAIRGGVEGVAEPNLRGWLRHGAVAMKKVAAYPGVGQELAEHNRLSQVNVLCQVEHLMTYPRVRELVGQGKLRLHAWWFDLGRADVLAYEKSAGRFVLIDEEEAGRILQRLDGRT